MNQGFAWWAFDEGGGLDGGFLKVAWDAGMRGVDFLPEEHWPLARDIGFELLTMDGHESIDRGFNDRRIHDELITQLRRSIEIAHDNGLRFVTATSGRKVGASDEQGITAFADALSLVTDDAESAGVGILIEPLNTKYDHPDHQCATLSWARTVVDRVSSPSVGILMDVYHTQIMEGDIINGFRDHGAAIRHIHTAGVPGRHEIDDRQEINYRGFAAAIRGAGYDGWVVHEFLPTRDPHKSLVAAHAVFDGD